MKLKNSILRWASVSLALSALCCMSCEDDDVVKEKNGQWIACEANVDDFAKVPVRSSSHVRKETTQKKMKDGDAFFFTEYEQPYVMTETPKTRGTMKNTIDGDFSLYYWGNESVKSGRIQTAKTGKPHTKVPFPKEPQEGVEFYAIYPSVGANWTWDSNDNMLLSYSVKTDVKQQFDLLVAKTKRVTFSQFKQNNKKVDLTFKHAFTAVKIKLGANIPQKRKLKNVVIEKVNRIGKFDVKAQAWTNLSKPYDFTITLPASTPTNEGTMLADDNMTMFMLPQDATKCKIRLNFTDGTFISFTPKKPWEQSTTMTYTISGMPQGYSFHLEATGSVNSCVKTEAPYSVESYVKNKKGDTRPMPWKIVGYKKEGDANFSMNNIPSWLSNPSAPSGKGNVKGQTDNGQFTLTPDITDKKAEIDNQLKNHAPRGSQSNPWDLSMHNVKGQKTNMNTANTYIVSAPGWYKIPMVYGNAIENGEKNEGAFNNLNGGKGIPKNFPAAYGNKHRCVYGENLWDVNGVWSAKVWYMPKDAKVEWATVKGLVQNLSITDRDNEENRRRYLIFEVKKENLEQGVAIVGVYNHEKWNGTGVDPCLWSWTIWAAPEDALDEVRVRNTKTKNVSIFPKYSLGWAYREFYKSNYDKPRSVEVMVQQIGGYNDVDTLTITQLNGESIRGYNTCYQWGRHEAMLHENWTKEIKQGNLIQEKVFCNELGEGISHPTTSYSKDDKWCEQSKDWANLWDVNCNSQSGVSTNPLGAKKSIYDPCPVGFRVPSNNEFDFTAERGHINDIQNNNAIWHDPGVGIDDIEGFYLLTHYDENGNSPYLFLPAYYRFEGKEANYPYAVYWFSFPYFQKATDFYFDRYTLNSQNYAVRNFRASIFPISEKQLYPSVINP